MNSWHTECAQMEEKDRTALAPKAILDAKLSETFSLRAANPSSISPLHPSYLRASAALDPCILDLNCPFTM